MNGPTETVYTPTVTLYNSRMRVTYDTAADLLYLRFDDRKQELVNKRVSDDIVLDLGDNGKIVGIEILDASIHLDLAQVLPVEHATSA